MNSGGFLFFAPLYNLVFNVLVFLYRLSGENLGLALILIAFLSRLIIYPFTKRQIQNAEKSKEFQKLYEQIKEKYKKDKERQTQELAKLQAKYLPGQLSGCLTMIIQLVLLIQINYVIRNLLNYGAKAFNEIAYPFIDKFPEAYKFNVIFLHNKLNLGFSAKDVGITNFSNSWPYLLIALFLVLTQYFSIKILSGSSVPKEIKTKKTKKNDDEVPSFSEVFQNTNKQMFMFFPILIGIFSLNYYSGLSLYFAATSLFVIIQQGIIKRKELIKIIQNKYFVNKEGQARPKNINDGKEKKVVNSKTKSNKKKQKRKKRKRKAKKI